MAIRKYTFDMFVNYMYKSWSYDNEIITTHPMKFKEQNVFHCLCAYRSVI